jgi:hypothetical protein
MRRADYNDKDWSDPKWQQQWRGQEERRNKFKVLFGLCIALLGAGWLIKIAFNIPIDFWSNWPFLLIILGLLIGLKNGFSSSGWWILCLIGGVNAFEMYFPQHERYVLPAALIIIGLIIALKPKKKFCGSGFTIDRTVNSNNDLNLDVVFGGKKEVVTAKEFVAGSVNVTFAGAELNMMQCELAGDSAVLDIRATFGAVELVLPAQWTVKNEISPVFGNVEDERAVSNNRSSEITKTLILQGTCVFGNIEVKSY